MIGQARLAQALTVAWMLIEGVAAVGFGLAARSVALSAFGLDSGIELFTSLVVLRSLVVGGEAAERRASLLVGWGLRAVIAYVVLAAAAGLLLGIHAEPSGPGIVLTLASLAIMAGLWRWRLRLADRIGSAALRGDAACSLACLYMAAATLAGLALNRLFGWWWADPVAGLALIWWLRGEAAEALEAARAQPELSTP